MGITNAALYISIALFYNIFVHTFTSILYKDEPFKDKYEKTTVMLLIAGIFALVLARFMSTNDVEYKNYVVSMGLGIGGLLLILTSIFANWENIEEELKVGISGAFLIVLIVFSYKFANK